MPIRGPDPISDPRGAPATRFRRTRVPFSGIPFNRSVIANASHNLPGPEQSKRALRKPRRRAITVAPAIGSRALTSTAAGNPLCCVTTLKHQ